MARKKPPQSAQPDSRFNDANKRRPDGLTDEEVGVPAADMRKGDKSNDPDQPENKQPEDQNQDE